MCNILHPFLLLICFLFVTSLIGQNCNAAFTFEETGLNVQFTDQSTALPGDPIISWSWNFGDGATSTEQNPIHSYGDNEDYIVSLTITTLNGCTASFNLTVDICDLNVNLIVGNCNLNGMINLQINVTDFFGNAKDVEISIDGQLLPGSPFEIDDDMPVTTTYTLPGDGLQHTLVVQSTDISTCNEIIDFNLPDCNSNCFLNALSIGVSGGTTHNVDVGDNFFSPVNTTITLGDIVHFQWIGDGHSTTSDAASGPDSWNSGEIGFGSMYDVSIQNPGVHPYYCIPHGGPGGVGMSGSIIANCPASNQFTLNISFNATQANPAGYNVILDGVVQTGSPFSYNGTGPQNTTLTIDGDGQVHSIEIQDVNDPSCILMTNWVAPDCGAAPNCSLSLTGRQVGGCDASNQVNVEITVNSINGGASGFNIAVDGTMAPGGPFPYDPSGVTTVTIDVIGDGQAHNIVATDVADSGCTGSTTITTANCSIQCTFTNISASAGTSVTHNVEVQDFQFAPQNITITSGDIVEWVWTGAVEHTTTSDATTGPDAWDSGLFGTGATYQSPVLSTGVHPYYCIPHGAPGGVGMAGTITVQANCTNGNVAVAVSFSEQGGGFSGYQVLVDGAITGTFSYDPSGNNTASVNVPGDGLSHSITLQDIDNPTCTGTTTIITPDCNASTCQMTISAQENGPCNANNQVPVQVTVNDVGGGTSGFTITVDGTNPTDFNYSGTGTTIIEIDLPGDGLDHLIEVSDIEQPECSANASITTSNCIIPCQITNLTASAGVATTHVVEVQDFEFFPQHIIITAGDIVEWQWTGTVDHTSTSDATTGPDAWDSGLFGTGATFQSPVLSTGVHPYYCIPHGAPGGVGMAGTITVQANCTNGNVPVLLAFSSQGGSFNGFTVSIDGAIVGNFNYDPSGNNTITVNVPGDGQSHSILITDVDEPTCVAATSITTPDCNASTCQMTISAQENGPCNANDQVPVQITVNDVGGGASGFTITVDGANPTDFNYSGTGTTIIEIDLPGDGLNHLIEVSDIEQPECSANASITTSNCIIPCQITNLTASAGVATTHVVEVQDFEFFPQHIIITAGDIVEWQWTGTVDHTSTSDATTGPDAWDSGLFGTGATYQSPVLSTGVHPYYCIPHGALGGVGMAGTITVQANCTNGNVPVLLAFSSQGGSFNGFTVSIDGANVGNFNYDPSGNNTITVNVPGDGQSHSILITDVDDPTCVAATSITTPDCNASTCQMTISAQENGPCNANDQVPVQVTVNDVGGGTSGFTITVDGNNPTDFNYSSTGTTIIEIALPGDGLDHLIEVSDIEQPECSATVSVLTTNCVIPCQLTDLLLEVLTGTTHIVEVRDFNFEPVHLEVGVGDMVRWEWTGVVQHTSTSDAANGPDSWDSGLLSQGEVFEKVIETEGDHPYYCIPHGAPGGVGMAGTITAGSPSPTCENGQVSIQIQFTATNFGASGYEVIADGNVLGTFPYQPGGINQVVVAIEGDGQTHVFEIKDIDSGDCSVNNAIEVPNCNNEACALSFDVEQVSGCNTENEIEFELTINATNPGQNGFNVLIDGVPLDGNPFAYAPSGITVVSANLIGDDAEHLIQIMDVDSLNCSNSISLVSQDCTPDCQLDLDASLIEGCNFEDQVSYGLLVIAANPGTMGFNIYLDGSLFNNVPFAYQGDSTLVELSLAGNGLMHTIRVEDIENTGCFNEILITTPDCSADCQLTDLVIEIGVPTIHIVQVLDFEFQPKDISVNVGDIIRFNWIGDIPHTTTSDATSGEDAWNSGLLGQGAVYDIVIHNTGVHPYYCIPHGAPGGIGMAGSITVLEACEDGQTSTSFSFQSFNTTSEQFHLYLDGNLAPDSPFAYSETGTGLAIINVPGDGQLHQLRIEDTNFPNCSIDSLFQMPDCNDPCWDFAAKFDIAIDHATNSVTTTSTTTAATNWIWDWGDNNISNGASAIHTYATPGTYMVCLTASNTTCSDTICQEITIEDIFCEANFTFEYDGLTLFLYDQSVSSDSIISRSWMMDTFAIMTDSNPEFTFEDLGIYNICLTVESESCSSDTCTIIDLSNPCILFIPDFEYSIDEESLSLQLTDLSSGTPYTWLWGFGDGNTSNEQHPTHFYDLPGTYTLCLLVQDSVYGCNASYCTQIQVGVPNDIPILLRNHQVKIFPNPASQQQHIWTIEGILETDHFQQLDFKLYNIQGKTIMTTRLLGEEQIIFSVSKPLASGAYFVELRSAEMTYRGKLIIK